TYVALVASCCLDLVSCSILPRTAWFFALSLHGALPISRVRRRRRTRRGPLLPLPPTAGSLRRCRLHAARQSQLGLAGADVLPRGDRKSTRLNSSHVKMSYAVFCLKKKNIHVKADALFIH